MKIKRFIIISIATCSALFSWAQESKEIEESKGSDPELRYFNINKNLNIFNSVVRELDMLYVDSIDLDKTVRKGIDYMLNSLDPYTVYYNEDDMKDLNFMTTGEYAGVGSSVVYRDGRVMFAEPFEGKPAAIGGVKAGDIILEIDGKDMTSLPKEDGVTTPSSLTKYVSDNLKGSPGTNLTVKVERYGEKKPKLLKIKRENIVIDPITYTELLDDNVGYILLNSFTNKSASDVTKTFQDLKEKGMTSLILDLRDNGGGILEDAVQIVNIFVPKGKTIVNTKGKLKQSDRIYKTTVEALDTEIPLVVLINENTASASEIVAGSMQDLDRGVLIGKKSFGKGLVQVPREVAFGGGVKITTSKYYIPSGRCVQAMDYTHKGEDGSASQMPDSLKTSFFTSNGRLVKDGGGVSPDIIIEDDKTPNIIFYLNNQFIVHDWVSNWVSKHKTIENPKTFSITNEDYQNFVEFVKTQDFEYDKISEKTMQKLKEIMEFEGYYKIAEEEFKALEARLVPELTEDLELFELQITKVLNTEIIKRYYYQTGEIASLIKSDKEINKAIEILKDKQKYNDLLNPKKNDLDVEQNKDESTEA